MMWKIAYGYSDYEISGTGLVRRKTSHVCMVRWPIGRLLTPNDRGGYWRVRIYNKYVPIAQLVAETYICPRSDGLEINHKNGNKKDNSVFNLEWVTRSQNLKHARDTGLWISTKGEDHGMSKLTEDIVREIRKTKKGTRGLAKKYNVDRSLIRMVRIHQIWKHVE